MKKIFLIFLTVVACTTNPYQNATPDKVAKFKEVSLPFASGTKFTVTMSPYHLKNRHYSWNMDVPFGTPVHAIESGIVHSLWEPEGGGGCDRSKYFNKGHSFRILHDDGTVAQYLHVAIKVKKGDQIKKGQFIAVTALSGVVCSPQLHLMVYADARDIGPSGRTIPLRFIGIPGGLALPGHTGIVP